MGTFNYFNASRKVLIAVGLIFILSGLIVGGLNTAIRTKGRQRSGPMPSMSAAIGFEVLGLSGLVAAYCGLRSAKAWAWFACAAAYLPWTVRGFVSDARHGLRPLVIGEAVGLVLTMLALFSPLGRCFHERAEAPTRQEFGGTDSK